MALIGCTKTNLGQWIVASQWRERSERKVLTWGVETLPFEHMAEMSSASSTGYLGAFHPESAVYVPRHGTWDGWHEDTVNTVRPHIHEESYYRQKTLASRSRCRTWYCSCKAECCNPRRSRSRPLYYAHTPPCQVPRCPSNGAP